METIVVSQGSGGREAPAAAAVVDRILGAAAELFFQRGFVPVTTEEVSRAAGVSKKTLYRFFPAKEALLLEAVRREMELFARRLDDVAGQPGVNFVAVMRGFLRTVARQVARVGRVISADLRRVPGLWEEIDRIRREVILVRFDALLSRAIAEGLVRDDLDPRLIRELHVVLIQNLLTPDQAFQLEIPPLALYESVIRMVYGGILTPRGRRAMRRELEGVIP
jgi:AcrR family transcriptional regulator